MLKTLISKVQHTVDDTGWKALPGKMLNSVHHRVTHFSGTFYFKNILQNEFLLRLMPFEKTPVLIIAQVRSGSSWVGKVLSFSPEVAYLREPVTQAIIQKSKLEPFPFDSSKKGKKYDLFKKYADQGFRGIPTVPPVIKNSSDFFPLTRNNKHLLIKEVNPQAINFFIDNYSPKIIILLRHPAAVVDSCKRMGWLNDGYENFGYKYGTLMDKVVQACKNSVYTLQFYEDVVENPKKEFTKLYNFMAVKAPENFNEIIEEFCNKKNEKWRPYNTKRTSKNEARKWKQNLESDIIKAVKAGYMRSKLNHYRDPEDWR